MGGLSLLHKLCTHSVIFTLHWDLTRREKQIKIDGLCCWRTKLRHQSCRISWKHYCWLSGTKKPPTSHLLLYSVYSVPYRSQHLHRANFKTKSFKKESLYSMSKIVWFFLCLLNPINAKFDFNVIFFWRKTASCAEARQTLPYLRGTENSTLLSPSTLYSKVKRGSSLSNCGLIQMCCLF